MMFSGFGGFESWRGEHESHEDFMRRMQYGSLRDAPPTADEAAPPPKCLFAEHGNDARPNGLYTVKVWRGGARDVIASGLTLEAAENL